MDIRNDRRYLGVIADISDSIISLLSDSAVFSGELVRFKSPDSDMVGFAWDLEKKVCRIPLLRGSQTHLKVGDLVFGTSQLVHVRCGFGILGEMLNPLGDFLVNSEFDYREFELARLFKMVWCPFEVRAPGIIQRAPVSTPFMFGVPSVDCFIPVGCGQRELIIGDQNMGKTSLAITAIIHQAYRNNALCGIWNENDWCNYRHSFFSPCIYVAIGSKRSELVRLRTVLYNKKALHYTCIIFTSADDLAALQYLAPFAGCTAGEWFMNNGYNALVIYDDLTQHAVAFRQLALLLRRPPGREAYPGDVFFLHSRLLERAAQLVNGGSLTALPIIQTLGGDLSGYISTNVISITDGQIFLVKSLVNRGIRPAVDLSLSVSRVGSSAQYPAMTFVAKRVKSMYALYKIFAGIAKLGNEDQECLLHVGRGERLLSFFTQAIYETYSFYKQIVGMYALTMESTDVIYPSHTDMFFTLFAFRHFDYLEDVEEHLVTFFLETKLLEPLLIIFSFELIKEDITLLINEYSAFFESEIQDQYLSDAVFRIAYLFFKGSYFEQPEFL